MRLLLVEDDAMIGEAVLQVLRAEHYAVDWVRDGVMADEALKTWPYDLVLFDLGRPKRDGLDALRARRASVPVLVATACDEVGDRHGARLAPGQSERLGGLKIEVRFPANVASTIFLHWPHHAPHRSRRFRAANCPAPRLPAALCAAAVAQRRLG